MHVDQLLSQISTHRARAVGSSQLAEARRNLHYFGYAKVPFVVPSDVKSAVGREALELVERSGVRRELRFAETDNTPRRMRNVRSEAITSGGQVIPTIYASQALLDLLSSVAGEEVILCPYEPERYLITSLENKGDTHGWHWDDYSFALVWVIECPPADDGGFVQCVPNTQWDKSNPQVNRAIVSRPIYSIELQPGDLYMMRTDTTMHRVYPLSKGRRTILNMGYASTADLSKNITHETMDSLWAATAAAGRL
jgi:hypothetical protein